MSDQKVLAAFLAASVAIAAGSAWAASDPAANDPTAQSAALKDFGHLSADGARAYHDVGLARLAIYDGRTADAKKFVDEAATAFAKAKTDDTIFTKAENELMTSQQVAAKGAKMPATSSTAAEPGDQAKTSTDQAATKTAWLPVDGAMSLNEDYTLSPAKTKAVADANKSLAKGDRQGAMEKLRLASVDTSVVLEVLPVKTSISDANQAAQEIDAGKYYEGSQTLRHLQTAARYDVMNVLGTPKPASATASAAQPAKDAAAAGH